MKTRKKGGLVALFIFLIIIIGGGVLFSFPSKTLERQRPKEFAEEYSPEEVNAEKVLDKNGKTYFSFRGIQEKYTDFIEKELDEEGVILSEIESPEDYEDILEPEEFEKISELSDLLGEVEGEWIEADEGELLDFIRLEFPEFRKEIVETFSKSLIMSARVLETEEILEYYSLDDLVLRLSDVD